ncbi:MAG: hypothetical protein LBJ02_07870 [Bifidobacteriaceae bacterium]|jgi:hypothetical protein|nr:hypothetical protein [Bifidobacteriaceae bacterium]
MRKSPLIALTCLLALGVLTACGGEGGKTGKEETDDGTIPQMLLPELAAPDDPIPGIDEDLGVSDKAEKDWISAPWADMVKQDTAASDLKIIYVDGDTRCYQHAGFTVKESKSKVTVAAYVKTVEGGKDCPKEPAKAFKWGTLKLAEPLGSRELIHAGVSEIFNGFTWDQFTKAPDSPAEPPAEG